jgi:hypothetical protein
MAPLTPHHRWILSTLGLRIITLTLAQQRVLANKVGPRLEYQARYLRVAIVSLAHAMLELNLPLVPAQTLAVRIHFRIFQRSAAAP